MAPATLRQLGTVVLLFMVACLLLAYDHMDSPFFWAWISLAIGFLYLGYRSFSQATKLGREEEREHREQNRQIIALLSAIAEKQGVDTKSLLERTEETSGDIEHSDKQKSK